MKKGIIFLLLLLSITVGLLIFVKSEIQRTHVDKKLANKIQEMEEPQQEVTIAYLDIGQGDANLITFPNGEQMLIDCAIDARVIEALGRVMPFYDQTIEYLLVTHPDLDHYGGCIDVLNRFEVDTVIYNGLEKPYDDLWIAFHDRIEDHIAAGHTYTEIDSEQSWTIASTTLHFLYPDHSIVDDEHIPGDDSLSGANDTSIILKLTYGEMSALFTGDAEEELEEYLVQMYGDQLQASVLKAGHHGSQTSSTQLFLDSVHPSTVIVSAGKNNSFGHPSPRVLKRYERAGTDVWRTDLMGDILVTMTTSSYDMSAEY